MLLQSRFWFVYQRHSLLKGSLKGSGSGSEAIKAGIFYMYEETGQFLNPQTILFIHWK